MAASVSAAGALLWATHALLRERQWIPQGPETAQTLQSCSGEVNLLPALSYALPSDEDAVHVRALLVGTKLFVHFVSSRTSVQLSLAVSEYVKPLQRQDAPESEMQADGTQGRVLLVGEWRCNVEILRWRLERILFPEFSLEASLVASDAELSRLPEPLLERVGGFLSVPDFCRVTQTSKYLHRLQDTPDLWLQFLLRDYPTAQPDGDPRALYRTRWTRQRHMEAWTRFDRTRRLQDYLLRQQVHWRWRSGGRLPAPPLHLPVPPPFLPFGDDPWTMWPPHRPGLLDDEDFELLRDPFGFYLDPPYPYFY